MIDMDMLFCIIENGDATYFTCFYGFTYESYILYENPSKFQWILWVPSDLGNSCAHFCTYCPLFCYCYFCYYCCCCLLVQRPHSLVFAWLERDKALTLSSIIIIIVIIVLVWFLNYGFACFSRGLKGLVGR